MTQINGHIKNAALEHGDQFRLGERRPVELQAANRF
jgi:hypothetical protein